jgi:hypothetical protein
MKLRIVSHTSSPNEAELSFLPVVCATVIFLPVVSVILTFISIIISYGPLLKQFLHLAVLIIVNFPVLFKGYTLTCVIC